MAEEFDLYGLLGVPRTATLDQITEAYTSRTQALQNAYDILRDPESRTLYDGTMLFKSEESELPEYNPAEFFLFLSHVEVTLQKLCLEADELVDRFNAIPLREKPTTGALSRLSPEKWNYFWLGRFEMHKRRFETAKRFVEQDVQGLASENVLANDGDNAFAERYQHMERNLKTLKTTVTRLVEFVETREKWYGENK